MSIRMVPHYTIDESCNFTFAQALFLSPYRSNWIEAMLALPLLTSKSKAGMLYQIHLQL